MPTQRLLNLTVPACKSPLLLVELEGALAISTPFQFELKVVSPDQSLAPSQLLGKPATIEITGAAQTHPQVFNGIITAVKQDRIDFDGQRNYFLTVNPWLSLLADISDYRVNQQKTAPVLLADQFKLRGFANYDVSKLQGQYDPLAYKTQYGETDLEFVARIMSESGIYYTFSHTTAKHTLVLEDTGYFSKPYPGEVIYANEAQADSLCLHEWCPAAKLVSTAVTSRAFYFKNPDRIQTAGAQNTVQNAVQGQQQFEQYHYPNEVASENVVVPNTTVRHKLQREVLESNVIRGAGNYVGFLPGVTFELTQHDDTSQIGTYTIETVQLSAKDYTQRAHQGGEHHPEGELATPAQTFHNSFTCFPANKRYVPKLIPKRKSSNANVAKVVGPAGKEIYTDQYGRIKVQFEWDRHGQFNENSSCFIRTKQLWAGDGYGSLFIPRIGQEVLVDFENGDPDCPIVVAVLPNANNLPPFTPAKTPTQTGLHSKTVGATDASEGNILRFDDQSVDPEVYMKAQRDLAVTAKGKSIKQVGGTSTTIVKQGNYFSETGGVLSIEAGQEVCLKGNSSEIIINAGGVSFQGNTINIDTSLMPIPPLPGTPSLVTQHVMQSLQPDPNAPGKLTGTTPQNNVIPIVEIIYVTGQQTLYALTAAEFKELREAGLPLQTAMKRVVDANQDKSSQRQAVITQAKKALNQQIQPLVQGPGSNDITEVVKFNNHQWIYVPADSLKKQSGGWRKYHVASEADAKAIMTDGNVDLKKLKTHFSNNAEIEFSHDFSGSMGGWAQAINQKANFSTAIFGSQENPKLTASADAQLLRYTAGVSTADDFDLTEGNVSFSTDASAELALAEAKVTTQAFIPSEEGWDLQFSCAGLNGKTNNINFGAFRAGFDLSLFAFAGASVLGSVDIECHMVQTGEKSQLKINGTNKEETDPEKDDKDGGNNGVAVGVDAFAGAKAGCDVGCGVAWKNIEQGGAWSEFASISAEGDAAAGIGGDAEFKIRYSQQQAKFVVVAKAGIICGVGLSGSICTVVYAEHILSFVEFVYHKIMSQNFSFVGFVEESAFTAFNNLISKYIVEGLESIESTFEKEMQAIENWWALFVTNLLSTPSDIKLQQIEAIAKNINNNSTSLTFALPEVKGRLLYLLTESGLRDEIKKQSEHWYRLDLPETSEIKAQVDQIQRAIVYVLSYVQSQKDFNNVLQHMSPTGEKTGDANTNAHTLYEALNQYGLHFAERFPSVNDLIDSLRNNIVYPEEPAIAQPVQQNDQVTKYV